MVTLSAFRLYTEPPQDGSAGNPGWHPGALKQGGSTPKSDGRSSDKGD